MSETHWNAIYTTKEATNLSWFQDQAEPSLSLIGQAQLPPRPVIVDVGAGLSPLADALVAQGVGHLTLVDLSAAALAKTRARLPADAPVDTFAGSILDWQPERAYDLWHDRAAFHFLTDPADQARYLDVMKQALTPKGYALIGTFAPDGPEKCSGLPVQRYGAESLSARLGPDVRLIRSLTHDHHTPGGSLQRFHFGLFQRV